MKPPDSPSSALQILKEIREQDFFENYDPRDQQIADLKLELMAAEDAISEVWQPQVEDLTYQVKALHNRLEEIEWAALDSVQVPATNLKLVLLTIAGEARRALKQSKEGK